MVKLLLNGIVLLSLLGLNFTVAHAEEETLSMELNAVTEVDGGCRLIFVANNLTSSNIQKASYEIIAFDSEGTFSRWLVLEFSNMPVQKTRVFRFFISDQSCGNISRLLVNGGKECSADGDDTGICLKALKPASRLNIRFD